MDQTIVTPFSLQISETSIQKYSSNLSPNNNLTSLVSTGPPTEPVHTLPSTTEHNVSGVEAELRTGQTPHQSADDADRPGDLPPDNSKNYGIPKNILSPSSPGILEPSQTRYTPSPQEREKVEGTATHVQSALSKLNLSSGQFRDQPLRAETTHVQRDMQGHVEHSSQQNLGDEGSPEGLKGWQELAGMEKTLVVEEKADAMSVAPFPELECLSIVNNLVQLTVTELVGACGLAAQCIYTPWCPNNSWGQL